MQPGHSELGKHAVWTALVACKGCKGSYCHLRNFGPFEFGWVDIQSLAGYISHFFTSLVYYQECLARLSRHCHLPFFCSEYLLLVHTQQEANKIPALGQLPY